MKKQLDIKKLLLLNLPYNVAALPCSLIPTPSDDEQSPGIFHLQEDFE